MKNHLRVWLGAGVALLILALFAAIFITYAQPMKDEVFDLSPIVELSEVEVADTCDELGWTVYVQEGEQVTPLVHDGLGCFDGLPELGQTFYFSRVMQEKTDAPTIQLSTANRNFSVFLDGVLIYTDCPEQDNRIGYLTLPMREWDRKENVTVSLPEDYVGRTLTIAQSTPAYAETPRMATRVIPASVTLYCSYAYESALIAESFTTAVIGAISYALGLLLLIAFVRQLFLGHVDAGLFFLALTVFFAMAERMYATSFYLNYFGIPVFLSTETLYQILMIGTLLIFFATRASRIRPLAWTVVGVYVLSSSAFILVGNLYPDYTSPVVMFLWKLHDVIGSVCLAAMLLMSWLVWRKSSAFHRVFAPFSGGVIALWAVVNLMLPSRMQFLQQLATAFSNMILLDLCYTITAPLVAVSLLITLWQTIRQEISRYTEKKLILEMSRMAEQRYENLRKHNEEVMALRHDMNRHFTLLRQMTMEEKPAQYLDDLIGQNKKIRPVIQSGNEMIDIILSSRLSNAVDAGLQVEIVCAHSPETLPLRDADLCSLTMNLIDNAIEAARKSGAAQPFLRLDLHVKNNFFVFVCENSTAQTALPAEKEETVPKHGLGLKIVRQIAEHYDALLQTECTTVTYKVSLAIPLAHVSR